MLIFPLDTEEGIWRFLLGGFLGVLVNFLQHHLEAISHKNMMKSRDPKPSLAALWAESTVTQTFTHASTAAAANGGFLLFNVTK
jgi:hypothetical protein